MTIHEELRYWADNLFNAYDCNCVPGCGDIPAYVCEACRAVACMKIAAEKICADEQYIQDLREDVKFYRREYLKARG